MPLRPFPHPFATGIDIIHYSRLSKYIPTASSTPTNTLAASKRPNADIGPSRLPGAVRVWTQDILFRFFDKVFTENEQRDFWRKFRGLSKVATSRQNAMRWLGGRWAAKEAIIKSYAGQRRLYMRDVEIRTSVSTNAPYGIVLDKRKTNRVQPTSRFTTGAVTTRPSSAREVFETYKREIEEARWEKKNKALGKETDIERERSNEASKSEESAKRDILSPDGILDFGAVMKALEEDGPSEEESDAADENNGERKEEDVEEDVDGQIVLVSITHDAGYVVATALSPISSYPAQQ